MAINKKGQVAGTLRKGDLTHIFFWDPVNGMQDLGNLGGNSAAVARRSGMNDQGHICGSSEISPGGLHHAFLWDPKNPDAGLQDLGTLPGGTYSEANAINSKGQVVGYGGYRRPVARLPVGPQEPDAGLQDLGTLPGGHLE